MNITEHEMKGLLTGKCIPGDMRVNEDLSAYLVRKFDALQQQVNALAAENSLLLLAIPALKEVHFDNDSFDDVSVAEEIGFNEAISLTNKNIADTQTSATDAIQNEWMAKGVEMAVRKLQGIGDTSYASYELECLAKTIRAGDKS